METYSKQLKASHEAWKVALALTRLDSDSSQISSEALELALRELEDRLPPASPPGEDSSLSLDQAMAYLSNPTPKR
jgi:hypothetical protein